MGAGQLCVLLVLDIGPETCALCCAGLLVLMATHAAKSTHRESHFPTNRLCLQNFPTNRLCLQKCVVVKDHLSKNQRREVHTAH